MIISVPLEKPSETGTSLSSLEAGSAAPNNVCIGVAARVYIFVWFRARQIDQVCSQSENWDRASMQAGELEKQMNFLCSLILT